MLPKYYSKNWNHITFYDLYFQLKSKFSSCKFVFNGFFYHCKAKTCKSQYIVLLRSCLDNTWIGLQKWSALKYRKGRWIVIFTLRNLFSTWIGDFIIRLILINDIFFYNCANTLQARCSSTFMNYFWHRSHFSIYFWSIIMGFFC